MFAFLLQAIAVSLSGVLAPGPMTAVTLALGSRHRHAGALLAIGHGIVEFPLMIVIILGVGEVFQVPMVRAGVALAGGAFLLYMAAGMLRDIRRPDVPKPTATSRGPIVSGIILSAANPYFLLWWATVGLGLATEAAALGVLAFGLFAVLHWLCDLVWLEAMSWSSFKGTRVLGPKSQKVVLAVCGVALLVIGARFLYKGAVDLIGTLG